MADVPRIIRPLRLLALCAAGIALICCSVSGKTRWSAVHMIPDADLIPGGDFVIDAEGFYYIDSARGTTVRIPAAVATLGVIEWVNFSVGYAGGPLLGFKARLIGENAKILPSLTVGVHNILSHQEAFFYNVKTDSFKLNNEVYAVLGKTIEPIRTRFHIGVQTIPGNRQENFNPFFGVEWYLGAGFYTSIEVLRRHGAYVPNLFFSSRILQKKVEIAAGLVAIDKLLFEKDRFRFSLTSSTSSKSFVKQGVWFGLRLNGNLSFAKGRTFVTIDDRVLAQEAQSKILEERIDSLSKGLANNQTRVAKLDDAVAILTDSMPNNKERMKAIILDKIIALKTVHTSEPFVPEKAKQITGEITGFRQRAIPALKDILLDKTEDRYVRSYAASLLGDIGSKAAGDALIDVLSSEADTKIKIEALIALGKIKETQALYVIQTLANDPDDAVALTAQEVLKKIEKETGVSTADNIKLRKIDLPNDADASASAKADSTRTVAPDSAAVVKKAAVVDSVSAKPKAAAAPAISKSGKKGKTKAGTETGAPKPRTDW